MLVFADEKIDCVLAFDDIVLNDADEDGRGLLSDDCDPSPAFFAK